MKLINPISQILMVGAVVGGGEWPSWVCLGLGAVVEIGLALLLASADGE